MPAISVSDIHFTAAKPEDFDYFYDLRKRTMVEHFMRAGKEWPEAEELALHRQRFDVHSLRMISLKGERIGFVGVRPVKDAVDIELFCIEPRFQNQGIGRRVMEMILTEPELRGRKIILDVLHGNPAARLYERLGFLRTHEDDKLAYYALSIQAPQITPPAPSCG